MKGGTAGRKLAVGMVAAVAILHHDFWLWSDRDVVLGFLPVGLLYQVVISLLAAVGWALVVAYAWPSRVEELARGSGGPGGP